MNFYRGQKAPATRRQRRAKLLLAPRPWKSTESERSVEKIGEELQRYDTALSLSLSFAFVPRRGRKKGKHSDARIHRRDKFLGSSPASFLSALTLFFSFHCGRFFLTVFDGLINGINKGVYRHCASIAHRLDVGFVIGLRKFRAHAVSINEEIPVDRPHDENYRNRVLLSVADEISRDPSRPDAGEVANDCSWQTCD